jgi:hypothetical protein
MIISSLKNGRNIYFSATNLSDFSRNMFFEIKKSFPCNILFIEMLDSKDLKLCKERVLKDINNGVERSNTLTVLDNETILEKQHNSFIEFLKKESDFKKLINSNQEENKGLISCISYSSFDSIDIAGKIKQII